MRTKPSDSHFEIRVVEVDSPEGPDVERVAQVYLSSLDEVILKVDSAAVFLDPDGAREIAGALNLYAESAEKRVKVRVLNGGNR